jgi:hypothetical protein
MATYSGSSNVCCRSRVKQLMSSYAVNFQLKYLSAHLWPFMGGAPSFQLPVHSVVTGPVIRVGFGSVSVTGAELGLDYSSDILGRDDRL